MEDERLTSVFRRVAWRLRASARKITGTPDDADDALQDAFSRLWCHRSRIASDEQAERLLATSVRNAGIDIVRRRARYSDAELPDAPDEGLDDHTEQLLCDVTALIDAELDERQRAILYERDRYGWEIDEIAERHGMTEANVRMVLSRSRRRVRELYLKRKNHEI